MRSRKEIEEELIQSFENLLQYRYDSRRLRRAVHITWITALIGATLLTLNMSFYIPFIGTLFYILTVISFAFTVVAGITSLAIFDSSSSKDHDAWKDLSKEKNNIKSLRRLLTNMPIHLLDPASYPEHYIQEVQQDIQEKRIQADRYQRNFIITQSIIIFLSTAVTSVSGGWLDRYFTLPLLVPVLSGLISLITGFSLFLKFREKGANLRQTADALDLEYKAYLLGHGSYKDLDPKEARIHFTEQAEILRKEQLQRQQQLEQSSQQERTSSVAAS